MRDLTTSRRIPVLAIGAIGIAVMVGMAGTAGPLGSGAVHARQFTSGVNIVEVYAAVVEKSGTPVQGLRRDDFTVLEDGRPQALSTFSEADFPLSVALAIDRSFSMTPRKEGSWPSFSGS